MFAIVRQLHELLWYLTAALALEPARAVHGELRRALTATEAMTGSPADALLGLDVHAHREQVNTVLLQASELVRAQLPGGKLDYRGADLVGASLTNADLTGANLRGARLIGADLRRADLTACTAPTWPGACSSPSPSSTRRRATSAQTCHRR